MVGLGETDEEVLQVMRDMRAHGISMLTIGQYLAPSNSHLPVRRYVHPDTFKMFEQEAYKMGFSHAAVGPWCAPATTPTSRPNRPGYRPGPPAPGISDGARVLSARRIVLGDGEVHRPQQFVKMRAGKRHGLCRP